MVEDIRAPVTEEERSALFEGIYETLKTSNTKASIIPIPIEDLANFDKDIGLEDYNGGLAQAEFRNFLRSNLEDAKYGLRLYKTPGEKKAFLDGMLFRHTRGDST